MALLNRVPHGKLLCLNLPIVTRKFSTQKKSCEKIQSDKTFGFFFSQNIDSNLDIPTAKKHGDQTAAQKQQFLNCCKKQQRFVIDSEKKRKQITKQEKPKEKYKLNRSAHFQLLCKKLGVLIQSLSWICNISLPNSSDSARMKVFSCPVSERYSSFVCFSVISCFLHPISSQEDQKLCTF